MAGESDVGSGPNISVHDLKTGLQNTLLNWRIFYHTYISQIARFFYGLAGFASIAVLIMEFGFYYPPEYNILIEQTISGVIFYMVFYEFLSLLFTTEGFFNHIRTRKVELIIVLLVLVQWVIFSDMFERLLGFEKRGEDVGDRTALLFLSVSQIFLFLNTLLHVMRSGEFARVWSFNPSFVFLISFAFVILMGTLLLSMPRSTKADVSFIDIFFVVVSATCVTGLSPVDVSSVFTTTGQIILLAVIQIGGLGLMTLTSFFAFFLTGRVSIQSSLLMKDLLSEESLGNVKTLIRDIALVTFGIELLGAVYLYATTPAGLFHSFRDHAFYSLFHSVSAFCNAGFSLYSDSMVSLSHEGQPYLFGIMLLIMLGGLGFPVMSQLYSKYKNRHGLQKPVSVAVRLVLWVNLVLYITGFFMYFTMEQFHTLKGMGLSDQIFHSLFFTVTARTAGFNSTPTDMYGIQLTFFSLLLMWIGASPASTGGGIKTTTFAVVIIHIFNQLLGRDRVEIYKKTISDSTVQRAYMSVLLSLMAIFGAIFVLSIVEAHRFEDIIFEVVSAFGTVGLSRGITGDLTAVSKLILAFIMLMGRVGIVTFLIAFIPRKKQGSYRYPTEYVIVG